MIIKPDLKKLEALFPNIQFLEEIGSGGFKVVYKIQTQKGLEALKVVQIPTDPMDEGIKEENLNRIYREIDLLGKFKSPYLVKLASISKQSYEIGGYDYVIYSEEYIEGQSLRQKIKGDHKPDIAELKKLTLCLLHSIQELAEMKVVHRDIKPDNIMQTNDPKRSFLLLDFGLAFNVGGTPLTRNNRQVPGTLYYIAPEMLDTEFRQNLDHRADLYTTGLSLYEYASGVNPFARKKRAKSL